MTEALVVSNVVLWFAVVGLALVVLALVRQVGVLHERLAPVGALTTARGPRVGEASPALQMPDLAGETVRIGADAGRTLLFFVSPSCPVCKTLLPTVRRMATHAQPSLRLILASDGEVAEQRAFLAREGLDGRDYVLSTELGLSFEVAKLPYAVLIDEEGIVRAKGLVNTREHVESLFEAEAQGVGSLQEWMASADGRMARGEAA